MRINRVMYGWAVGVVMVIGASLARAQVLPSATFYTNTINITGASLKAALHYDIKGHTVLSYAPGTREALFRIDTDPTNSANIFLIYSEFSVGTNMWINDGGLWNREHLWPQSYGVPNPTDGQSDLFNLRPSDVNVNNTRGNMYYGIPTTSNTVGNAPGCYNDGTTWEPRDDEKGPISRSMFYMAVRYEGISGEDNNPNLELSDTPNSGASQFGKLTTLLAWNRKYAVTSREYNRNSEICQDYQHNRNPFIDNPDFADMVFLGVDGFTAWQGTHFTTAELANGSISGATADPDGDGISNLAEYALGHNPHVAEASSILSVTNQTVDGTNFVYLVHHKNHYASGITFTYQTCTDMVSWADATYEVLSSSQIDAQKDLVSVRFPADTGAFFVRFKVTQP